jgi:hypothetical protein
MDGFVIRCKIDQKQKEGRMENMFDDGIKYRESLERYEVDLANNIIRCALERAKLKKNGFLLSRMRKDNVTIIMAGRQNELRIGEKYLGISSDEIDATRKKIIRNFREGNFYEHDLDEDSKKIVLDSLEKE